MPTSWRHEHTLVSLSIYDQWNIHKSRAATGWDPPRCRRIPHSSTSGGGRTGETVEAGPCPQPQRTGAARRQHWGGDLYDTTGPQPRARAVLSGGRATWRAARLLVPSSRDAAPAPWTAAVTGMNPTTPDSAQVPRPWLPAPLAVIVATAIPTTLDTAESPTTLDTAEGPHPSAATPAAAEHTHRQKDDKGARQISGRGSGERSGVPTEDQRQRRCQSPTCVGYGATYGKPEEGPLITNLNGAAAESLSPV